MHNNQPTRDRLLHMDDATLLRHCRTDVFRGTGRGGQKRNTTESAVRLTHELTGISAENDDTRSQAKNRTLALRELRRQLALQWRQPPPAKWPHSSAPGKRSPDFALWMAHLLDACEAFQYRISDIARFCNTSTAQLVKDLTLDRQLWRHINEQRREHGHKPLKIR
ncbi:MAG: peptide chain release factor-like protein [Candidatus Pacebacteria bacterium]|nr:peptide chain release factor-like protein [Candidatus Paceibacterota bacterium]